MLEPNLKVFLVIFMSFEIVARHSDFEKIRSAFIDRYGKAEGEKKYNAWLQKLDLDQSKAYGDSQRQESIVEGLVEEKFSVVLVTESLADKHPWVKPHLEEIKADCEASPGAQWYLVNALFPWTSMNGNVYTDEELSDGTKTIIDKPNDLDHTDEILNIASRDAQYFKKSCEVLVRVPRDTTCSVGNFCQLIDNAEKEENGIVHVSVEAKCLRGSEPCPEGGKCNGLCFTGLGWLTKKTLPGVPLTTIQPIEQLLECLSCKTGVCSFHGSQINKEVKKITDEKVNEKVEAQTKNEGASNADKVDQKTDPLKSEKAAKFCPGCGKPLEDSECKNKECELFGSAFLYTIILSSP